MNSNLKWVKYTASCLAILLVILLTFCIYLIATLKEQIKDYDQYFSERSDSLISVVHEELESNNDLLQSMDMTKSMMESDYSQLSNSFLNISKAYNELNHMDSIIDKKHNDERNNYSAVIAQDISLYFKQHQNQTNYPDEIIKKINRVNNEWIIIFDNATSRSQTTLKLSSSANMLTPNPHLSIFNQ